MTTPDNKPERYLYVSWGGSGRASSLRQAIQVAEHHNAELRYLAVLDPRAFPDLDEGMTRVVIDELRWLLETEIDLAQRQTEIGHRIRLNVEAGEVGEVTAASARSYESTKILIGAPIPVSASETVEDLVDALEQETGLPVEIIEPLVHET